MAYQRALWHSGLTYQQTCSGCQALVRYTDASLDYRPWFADGFVYCPRCRKPLRHNERYAIDQDGNYINPQPAPAPQPVYQQYMPQQPAQQFYPQQYVPQQPVAPQPIVTETLSLEFVTCKVCGRHLADGDKFCSQCGAKKE